MALDTRIRRALKWALPGLISFPIHAAGTVLLFFGQPAGAEATLMAVVKALLVPFGMLVFEVVLRLCVAGTGSSSI